MSTRLPLLIAPALAALWLCGCAPTRYEATVKAPDEGAVVSGWIRQFPLLKVVVMEVDGKPRLGWDAQMPAPLLIDPGEHVIRVRGVYIGYDWVPVQGGADVDFKVVLEQGRRYDLRIARDDDVLTFWIEDAATHAAIGERQAAKAKAMVIVGGP